MEVKCPMCGAPMEDGCCSYCGYIEKKPDNIGANVNTASQQTVQPQVIQSDMFSNNSASGNSDTTTGESTKGKKAALILGALLGALANHGDTTTGVSTKSKKITLILCVFLGFFGVHRFYVGDFKMGILYLCTLGLFVIGWMIDIIRILTGSFKDSSGLPLQ